MATALYRAYGREQLLYVGVTDHPMVRLEEHREKEPWWADVTEVAYLWFDDRAEALAEEARIILTERPLWNIVGAADPATRLQAREARRRTRQKVLGYSEEQLAAIRRYNEEYARRW